MAIPTTPLLSDEALLAHLQQQFPTLTRAELIQRCSFHGWDLDVPEEPRAERAAAKGQK